MSEWIKATGEVKKETKEMEKKVKGYSYRYPDKSETTDEKIRRLIADEINKSRDFLFPLIENSYRKSDIKNASALEEVMQWLDVSLLELGLPLIWSETAGYKSFEKLIRLDTAILKNSENLAKALEKFHDVVMKGREKDIPEKCVKMKKYITDVLSLYKKRRHILEG